jgi:hypothetical protein
VPVRIAFSIAFDETGRATLAGLIITPPSVKISAITIRLRIVRNSRVFGNGFSSHRAPLEFSEQNNAQIFGGMEKHFTRFAGSTPRGFAGAADSPSPLMSSLAMKRSLQPGAISMLSHQIQCNLAISDHGELDLSGPPTNTLTREHWSTRKCSIPY